MIDREKRIYSYQITINKRKINSLEISTHYEKHNDITDELILELVKQLDNQQFIPEGEKDNWEYFRAEPLLDEEGKTYKLVWCWEKGTTNLRIRTCHRTRKKYNI